MKSQSAWYIKDVIITDMDANWPVMPTGEKMVAVGSREGLMADEMALTVLKPIPAIT